MPGHNAKPDFLDMDKDGDKEESMKEATSAKAQSFKDKKTEEVKARMR
jgi:hypothetical protein